MRGGNLEDAMTNLTIVCLAVTVWAIVSAVFMVRLSARVDALEKKQKE